MTAVPLEPNPRKTSFVRKLGPVDIAALRAAVLAIPADAWEMEDATKPNKFGVLDETRHIVFRFLDSPRDWRRFHDREAWPQWRGLLEPVLAQAVRPYGYARGIYPRVMFAKMPPGAVIHPHIDDQPAAKWPHKIHVPLLTNAGVVCFFGGGEHYFPPGEAVEVNNLGPHWVRNGGNTDRVHLIFEYYDADQPEPSWLEPNSAASSGDRDVLFQEAKDLRARQRISDALNTLARLQERHPRFSRLYQERGHCHVLLGNAPAAMDALREAVRLNPTLPASWDMLEQLYRMLGDSAQAAGAARHLATLRQLPAEVVMANSLLVDGDLLPAETVIRDYLRKDGDNVGALRLLARIRKERDALEEAEALLESVLTRAPDYDAARLDYAMVLLQQQKYLEARQQAEHLLKRDANNREYLKQYGAACVGLGDYEPLVDIYERLLAGQPPWGAEVADLRLWRGNALKITGRSEEAIADYRASLAAQPDYGAAWFSLANLKTYRFSDDEIARLRAAESQPAIQDADRIYLCFALGKALEDRDDYAASWAYYSKGNTVRRAASRYRPEIAEACVLRLKHVFTSEFFAARAGWSTDDPAPIFILGLPRSGSTLIEQILASHSLVEGTQELTLIGRYAAELCGQDPDCGLPLDPAALQRLTPDQVRSLGAHFLSETRIYRRLGRPFFIDKMPNNFWHIGLIHLMLPRSAIIDVRREPMACCFSNLKQLFGTVNQEFTYDVEYIARHYRAYLDLMRHWDDVLPGRVLRVRYEDVVEDIEGSVRRMLAYCGLTFEPGCLAFHETRRSVRTPSSEQVRRPIGREGLAQWRNYTPWLEPLRHALGDALTDYRT